MCYRKMPCMCCRKEPSIVAGRNHACVSGRSQHCYRKEPCICCRKEPCMCCRKSGEVGYTFHCQALKYEKQQLKGEIVLGDIVHNVSGKRGSRNVRLLVTLGPQSGSHACATGREQEAGPFYKISRSAIPTHFLYQGSISCRLHNLPKQCYLLGKQVSEYLNLMGTFCIQIKTARSVCLLQTPF